MFDIIYTFFLLFAVIYTGTSTIVGMGLMQVWLTFFCFNQHNTAIARLAAQPVVKYYNTMVLNAVVLYTILYILPHPQGI